MGSDRLELYVSGANAESRAALEQVERLRAAWRAPTVELVVFDAQRSPLAAREAGVVLVPTLILRTESGERRCFGDFSELAATRAALGIEGPTP